MKKKIISAIMIFSLLSGLLIPIAAARGPSASGNTDYTIVNPYDCVDFDTWDYYKANLHTHSVASDGDFSITDFVGEYYKRGYDIIAMTDHGVINRGLNKPRKTNGIFNYFRKADPMSDADYERITSGSDRGGRGMTEVRGGIEINMAVLSKTHVNGYFTEYGQGVWGKENDYRTAPAMIEKQGGYSVLNHVGDWVNSNNFPERSHMDMYIAYFANIFNDFHSCLGMEIINNSDSVSRADRALWDELLQVVIPTGRNIIAFADDDSERMSDVGNSFEYFLLPKNTEDNIKSAMKQGNFFACSKYIKYTDGTPDFVGTGEVPLAKNIIVNQADNTIEVVPDSTRDCKKIKWIANGEVVGTDYKIDLNDIEDKLGCYIRFQLEGDGGVTYSQAFELKYDGRVDKPIPQENPFFKTEFGKMFLSIYHSIPFGIIQVIVEKIGLAFK